MRSNSTQSRKLPMDDFDDIPVARRDNRREIQTSPRTTWSSGVNRRIFWLTGLTAGVVALLAGAIASFLLYSTRQATTAAPNPLSRIEPLNPAPRGNFGDRETPAESSATAAPRASDGSEASLSEAVQADQASEAILGHYPYAEVAPDKLTAIAPGIQLATEAADAYRRMQSAASADGVRLVPVSGFRSKVDQEYLFFEVKGARGQTAEQRAKVSAPPGHSEHHTGYALDIGDADAGGAILNESFEETRAFQWLEQNAPYYSFELSFPRGNEQGVSYEPWHWRYVGNQESLEIFHKGR